MTRRHWALLALLVPLYLWRLDRPGFSDTEGMFAEPARGMVASHDWVTPRVNGEPFFTKPPLMYWLPAALWTATGPTEWARIWPASAALGTVAVTAALGSRLFGRAAGFAAAAVLGTSAGQFVEARMLRADMVLMLALAAALWAWSALRAGAGRACAAAFWTILAVGLLDKGFVVLLLAGGIIAGTTALDRTTRPARLAAGLRRLHLPLGLAVLALVAGPWHALAAWRNPGFLWDYVVNQHVLFFFDRKMPRDSIPDSLAFFWAIFAVRGLPWSLLWPVALVHAWRTARARPESARAYQMVAAWLVVVLGFFSLASSRLEHYALPALPAAALLVGALLADTAAGHGRVGRAALVLPIAGAGFAALATLAREPGGWIVALEPTLAGYGLEGLVVPALLVGGIGLVIAAGLCVVGRHGAAFAAGLALSVAVLVIVQIARERVEPLFSWRPIATRIRPEASAGTPVFFRASDEYQLCGGLAYYLDGRRLGLLMPTGWVPPTFLEGRVEHLFASRETLTRAWRSGDALLVSDDVWPPGAEVALAPGPYAIVARAGSKVVLRPSSDGVPSTVRP